MDLILAYTEANPVGTLFALTVITGAILRRI